MQVSLGADFESVLQAARVGAEWAWATIYRDLSPAVLRYLRAHGAAEPEDIVGDTFVQVVRGLPAFTGRSEAQFRAWVFTIARNRLLDEFRRSARRPLDYQPPEQLPERCAPDDTEAAALRRLAYERVSAVLERLSPDQRDVIFLRVIAELPIEEVARIVRKRPGAVKSLQNRGFAAIRKGNSEGAVS